MGLAVSGTTGHVSKTLTLQVITIGSFKTVFFQYFICK